MVAWIWLILTSRAHWRNFVDTVKSFEEVGAPYQLHAGTLLGLVRDCALKSDLDFAVPRTWFTDDPTRVGQLGRALKSRGFHYNFRFGTIQEFGFEIAYARDRLRVDIFTIDEIDTSFDWGYWRFDSGQHRCTVKRTSVEDTFYWGNLTGLRIPMPVEDVLESLYSKDWRAPTDNWPWTNIFSIGSCDPQGTKGYAKGFKRPS